MSARNAAKGGSMKTKRKSPTKRDRKPRSREVKPTLMSLIERREMEQKLKRLEKSYDPKRDGIHNMNNALNRAVFRLAADDLMRHAAGLSKRRIRIIKHDLPKP